MFLTRFRVNTARSSSRRILGSPQIMHAAVMSCFPALLPSDAPPPGGPRILWRADHTSRAEVILYIVSPGRPDLTHLVEQAGWPAAATPIAPGWETRAYSPFLDRLQTGDRWAFRLTANPVHHVRRKDDEPTKRTAHVTPAHQMGWLLQRQESAGFRILERSAGQPLMSSVGASSGPTHPGNAYELAVHSKRDLVFAKRPQNGSPVGNKAPVQIVAVTFDGHLEVTDPARLRTVLTQGIGRAKAYGCGLLTLVPIRTGE
ncbi:type I-E CRISPR-associated protein Cas6/Cse3/CasE [Streptomyces zhihengii]|uniref:Type I-E CRISPR-associated protein Cas6/Cse3/CasE n=1 Tax=Streptomyces zhihengii TaxID=1818004 RepID=A0ABS2V430_9ACTN|nr:type I-E CRISPR-associated protein Cas6/Cse3/CasE [Streptomyces zhihengii]MBM9624592.1 type I-E CRISPR-associated protein Cas6/Cse3/CasE [Streptomyces zhihengii]